MRRRLLLLLALGLASACDAEVDGPRDATSPEVDAGHDAGAPPDICDELGLPRRPMLEGTGDDYHDVAGDFSVETLSGRFTASEAWTGCESYVFLNYAPTDYGRELFVGFPDGLLVHGPRNVHYFFTSYEADAAAARARVEPLALDLEEAFRVQELSEEEREFWRARVHFVVEPLRAIEGSPGALARGKATVEHAFAIARDQRFDPVGSLSVVGRGGFRADLGMAAYAGHYYNYRVALEDRLAAEEGVTVVPLLEGETVTDRSLVRVATLPSAEVMAGFDTLEIDLEDHCRLGPADCSEWDRNAYVRLCLDPECEAWRELARWITPYSRPGRARWVMDASPLLGLLHEGGEQTFEVVLGPEWERATEREVSASLRLSRRGEGPRPDEATLAFVGGEFDADYDDRQAPFRFTAPEGTARTELVVIVSGHGQTEGDNCAEWCEHEHTFTLDGAEAHRVDFPGEAGQPLGCAELASEGVIPGQWGNWAPRRAGWCPGFPVAARRLPLDATPGEERELTYQASFRGMSPRGGQIDLSAYVVTYR